MIHGNSLKQYPEIVIIARDRGGLFAEGTARRAPQAQQIADRFHLLNRPTLQGKCFTPKDGKWKSLSETSEVKRWRATIFA